MPKCTVCGGEVTDIGPLDVPYHVECVMAAGTGCFARGTCGRTNAISS